MNRTLPNPLQDQQPRAAVRFLTGIEDENLLDELMQVAPTPPQPLGPAATYLPLVDAVAGETCRRMQSG